MTSKKHYKAVAELINRELSAWAEMDRVTDGEQNAIKMLARGLSNIFEQDNSNFQRGMFLRACGIDVEYTGGVKCQNCGQFTSIDPCKHCGEGLA